MQRRIGEVYTQVVKFKESGESKVKTPIELLSIPNNDLELQIG